MAVLGLPGGHQKSDSRAPGVRQGRSVSGLEEMRASVPALSVEKKIGNTEIHSVMAISFYFTEIRQGDFYYAFSS